MPVWLREVRENMRDVAWYYWPIKLLLVGFLLVANVLDRIIGKLTGRGDA